MGSEYEELIIRVVSPRICEAFLNSIIAQNKNPRNPRVSA